MEQIGFQLYTVMKLLTSQEESRKTLEEIKDMGYTSVQLCGSIDLIERYCQICSEIQLPVLGALTDMECCETETEKLFALCEQYGMEDIGISSQVRTEEDAKKLIARVNSFASLARERGIRFSYHNHGHEFIQVDGEKTIMDLFLDGFDANVDFMPDTYWIQDGGADVRYFLEKTRGRTNILHLKDMKRLEEGHTFAEVGHGNLYMDGIIETARECGVRHFVVEQDKCDGNPLDSLRKSIEYLKRR